MLVSNPLYSIDRIISKIVKVNKEINERLFKKRERANSLSGKLRRVFVRW